MSSSIGLCARLNRRTFYTMDGSDDDSYFLPKKRGKPQEKNEQIHTSDTNMGDFVEDHRGRSSRSKPNYVIDESDDDYDILPRKDGKPLEKIDRSDTNMDGSIGVSGRLNLHKGKIIIEESDDDSDILQRKFGKHKEKIERSDTHKVEGLCGRSGRSKRNYVIDESEDDGDILPRKRGKLQEKIDRRDTKVEGLRGRSNRSKPNYVIDESEDDGDILPQKSGKLQEKIDRSDTKDNACQACGEDGNLLSCVTCTYSFHPKCIVSPLRSAFRDNWSCPECVSPLNDIDKILDCEMRSAVALESDTTKLGSKQNLVKLYLVKWKGLSYLHCTWIPEEQFLKAFKNHPGLKTKVNNFHRHIASANEPDEDFVAIRPEWTMVDRILACRGHDDKKEYLVKWKELPYDECYWELKSDISAFQTEIERFNTFQSRSRKNLSRKKKSSIKDDTEQQKEFVQYECSPQFLSGGTLHPYQLEGLNFLRFSWYKQTHVILADEMGLGKTIQSIAFLASLFEENVSPHLVVAPLSTLRNWEREFATWAPQMNVVMYFGPAKARAVIREYEFYFPMNKNKIKKKKSRLMVDESKQKRIKFDVLLTSYEMINSDTSSLKSIKWDCMIVDEVKAVSQLSTTINNAFEGCQS
ncbi:hypothetical protein VNO78_29139 [Psophocarpus tetragonolobus]|uniref:Uncharacterized protein n=1 Tax=Psophocarpus tetragonolobus TaxID=3891 RepID=A0AAN9X0N5_PSOTE